MDNRINVTQSKPGIGISSGCSPNLVVLFSYYIGNKFNAFKPCFVGGKSTFLLDKFQQVAVAEQIASV